MKINENISMKPWKPWKPLQTLRSINTPVRDYHNEVIKYIKDKFSITEYPNYEKNKRRKKS